MGNPLTVFELGEGAYRELPESVSQDATDTL